MHIISGASDEEQQRDGDFLDKQARCARTDEYVGLLRKLWTSDAPFDHEGVDQVAESLLDYYDLGVTTFLVRGFEPLEDALAYGELIERTHDLVAARDRTRIAAE